MTDESPVETQSPRLPLSKLPLVLAISLIAGYWMTSSSLFNRPGLYDVASPARYPREYQGSNRHSGEEFLESAEEDADDAGRSPDFVTPSKYYMLCRVCKFAEMPPAKVPSTPKTSIHVLGERHSGTNAMEQLLRLNFDVRVVSNFTMHKHFMQPYPRWPADYSKHLIILAVINVYDWVAAMRRSCYHCEGMEGLRLPGFLSSPFVSHPADVDFYSAMAHETNASWLQGKLRWREAEASSSAGEGGGGGGRKAKRGAPPKQPALYALHHNKTLLVPPRFSNVMAMRRLKICQVLDLAVRFNIDLEIVRLEDFLYPHHQIELMRRLHYSYRLPLLAAAETFNATTDALDESGEGGGDSDGGAEEEEPAELGKIKPLQVMSKAARRKRKFRPQRKLRLSMYYRGSLGALDPDQRDNVTLINSALDWQLELGLGYTPIT